MILTQEEIAKRLNSPDNLANVMREESDNPKVKVVKWQGCVNGRPEGKPNLTEDEIIAAGVLARTMGNATAASVLGISPQTASNISHDNNGYRTSDKIDKAMDNITKMAEEVAAEKLLVALGMITEDKLSVCSAKDLSTVAMNMSRTIANVKPGEKNSGVKVSIIMHQPKPSREEHFEMIEVSA
jgi:hypothetical protein